VANLLEAKFEFGDLLAGLTRFENVVQQKVLFTGAATMARVIYDEVKLNASPPRLGIETGTLRDAIYWAKSPEETTPTHVVYKVSWNKRKAPHGHLVEFGHKIPYFIYQLPNGEWRTNKNRPLAAPRFVRPYPFVRPAFAHMGEAINAGLVNMTARFTRELGL
jgi:hypothetical protein